MLHSATARFLAIVILCAGAIGNALGFGVEGHRAVADIATKHLAPQTSRAIADLLQYDLNANGQLSGRRTLAEVASWPDEIRLTATGRGTAPWHYDNIPVCGSATRDQFCSADNCASARIEQMLAVLRDRNALAAARNEALKWTIHLVADIHQPLHVADHRDRGGNSIAVSFFGETRSPAGRLNLHAVWDLHLVQRMLRESGGEPAFVAGEITAAERSAWEAGTIGTWIAESHDLATTVVYGKLPGGFACDKVITDTIPIESDYYRSAAEVLRLQLRRAGIRLAKLLNAALQTQGE